VYKVSCVPVGHCKSYQLTNYGLNYCEVREDLRKSARSYNWKLSPCQLEVCPGGR
jgi:hypothetical protein